MDYECQGIETVGDLIEALAKMDPALPVHIPDAGCGCCATTETVPVGGAIEQTVDERCPTYDNEYETRECRAAVIS